MAQPKTIEPPVKTPAMRMRAFYCDDETWDNAMARAQKDGLALAEVMRHYLREYGNDA